MKCTELAKCRKPFSPLKNPHMADLLRRTANKLPKLDVPSSNLGARSIHKFYEFAPADPDLLGKAWRKDSI